MALSVGDAIDRLPPGRMRERLAAVLAGVAAVANGTEDREVSQRIALIAFTTRVVSAVIAYFLQVLLARWIGDYQYGIFAVVWVGAIILGGVSCLGYQKAIVRFVPEYTTLAKEDLLRGVLLGSRVQGVAASVVIAGLGIAGLILFRDSIAGPFVAPLYLAAVCLPMLALTEVQEGIARAFSWSDLALWPTYIYRPLLIPVVMGVALLLGFPADAGTAMGAVIVATLLTTIHFTAALDRRLGRVVPPGPRAFATWTWMTIALPIFMVEGFFNLLTNVDVLIVGWLTTPEKVAVYYAAVKTMALVHFVYFSVRTGSAHRFAGYHAAGDRGRLEALLRDTVHWTFWPSLAMAAFLLVAGWPLLRLFGPTFVEGYPLLWIFVAGLLCRAAVGPAETLLSMSGHQVVCALVYLVAFLANVALSFVLIPPFGLPGAASATAIALAIEATALFVVVRRRLGIDCSIFAALRHRPVGEPAT